MESLHRPPSAHEFENPVEGSDATPGRSFITVQFRDWPPLLLSICGNQNAGNSRCWLAYRLAFDEIDCRHESALVHRSCGPASAWHRAMGCSRSRWPPAGVSSDRAREGSARRPLHVRRGPGTPPRRHARHAAIGGAPWQVMAGGTATHGTVPCRRAVAGGDGHWAMAMHPQRFPYPLTQPTQVVDDLGRGLVGNAPAGRCCRDPKLGQFKVLRQLHVVPRAGQRRPQRVLRWRPR